MEARTPKDIITFSKGEGIEVVDLRFMDFPGLWQHFSVPAREFAEESAKCYKAGAAMVHVHARLDDGMPTHEVDKIRATHDAIKDKTPELIVNLSSAVGIGKTPEQRITQIVEIKPEMASLNTNTMNFSIIDRKTGKLRKSYTDIMSTFQMYNAREISMDVADNFMMGGSDEVRIVYGKFHSVAVQKPEVEELLPIKPVTGVQTEVSAKITGAYTYEPEPGEIMEVLLPLYLNVQVYHAMLEVGASEHAARMTAMDSATSNAKEMIDRIHRLGGRVLFHSCGAIAAFIPDLIALGVDVLDPIQPAVPAMQPERLAAEFGGRICFHGGIDMQRLLPAGSPAEVAAPTAAVPVSDAGETAILASGPRWVRRWGAWPTTALSRRTIPVPKTRPASRLPSRKGFCPPRNRAPMRFAWTGARPFAAP